MKIQETQKEIVKIFCRYNYYYYICNIKQQTKI